MTYICEFHNTVNESYCPQCMERWDNLPPIETMPALERAVEFEYWCEHAQVTVPFDRIKERLSGLLGRDLFTHELATSNLPNLIAEAYGNAPAPQTFDDILKSLPKRLHIIGLDDSGNLTEIKPEDRSTNLTVPPPPDSAAAN